MRGLPLPILRVPPPSWITEAKIAAVRSRLEPLLESVRFPVRRWQLIVAADHHGSDHVTRQALQDLWAETYPDVDALVAELVQTSPIGRPSRSATTPLRVPD